ncbi:unnamed protein product [Prunus armeniaca]|uniref:Uncharacterized protein n=1 Tax=Prunus armeniaca TaxID=36596 RepID=A0A6J5WIE9_PRUAR|nr:unnamed protein product [Prunus armeniaca]
MEQELQAEIISPESPGEYLNKMINNYADGNIFAVKNCKIGGNENEGARYRIVDGFPFPSSEE